MKASYWVFLLIGACNVINVNAQKIKGSDTYCHSRNKQRRTS
jgi:phosphate transport system substrate-binding protein